MTGGWDNQNMGGAAGPQDPHNRPPHHNEQSHSPDSYAQGHSSPQYGQPQYGQQPYQSPAPGHYPPPGQPAWGPGQSLYGNPYAPGMPVEKRSDVLGIIGLAVVFIATVLLIIVSWTGGQSFGQFILDADAGGLYTEEDMLNDPLTAAYVRSATGLILGAGAICVAGLAGWIISIVATVQRRGRGFGIVGIILGVFSVGIAFATFFAGIMPVLGY